LNGDDLKTIIFLILDFLDPALKVAEGWPICDLIGLK